MDEKPRKFSGKLAFASAVAFTCITIGLVMWDEARQRERRQASVKYRLNAMKQQENIKEYHHQRQIAEETNQN